MKELTATSLLVFEDSLKNLSRDEIKTRRASFMNEVIESYGQGLVKYRKVMIAMGIVSVLFLPLFFVSIPIYSIYLSNNRERKEKIRRTLDQWQEDLCENYDRLYQKLRSF